MFADGEGDGPRRTARLSAGVFVSGPSIHRVQELLESSSDVTALIAA